MCVSQGGGGREGGREREREGRGGGGGGLVFRVLRLWLAEGWCAWEAGRGWCVRRVCIGVVSSLSVSSSVSYAASTTTSSASANSAPASFASSSYMHALAPTRIQHEPVCIEMPVEA